MYEVYADQKILYASYVPDKQYHILKPQLKQDVGKVHTFTFDILPSHPLYSELVRFKSVIEVREDGNVVFRGRILDTSRDLWKRKKCTCEDALSYLNDSWIDKMDETQETITAFFVRCVNAHNATVDASRQLWVGNIDIPERNQVRKFKIDSESNVMGVLESALVNEFGGYLRVRYTAERNYLDYIYRYDQDNDQTIEFAKNLIEIDEDQEGSELFSVLIPTGKDNLKITAEATTQTVTLDNGVEIKMTAESPYMEITEGIQKYGRIYRIQNWSDVESIPELIEKGKKFISTHYWNYPDKLTLKAIDMVYLDPTAQRIRVGDSVRLICSPLGIDHTYVCQSLSIDIQNPDQTSYTFGDAEQVGGAGATSSGSVSSGAAEEKKTVENVTKKVSMLESNDITFRGNISIIESNISVLQSNISILESNLDIVQSNVNVLKSNVSVMQSNISVIESNLSIAQSNISALESNISVMQSNISVIESNLSVAQSNISVMNSNISAIESNLSVAQSNISVLESNMSVVRSNISMIDSNLDVINGNINVINGQINAMSANISTIMSNYITADYITTSLIVGEVAKASTVTVQYLYATGGAMINGSDIMGAAKTVSVVSTGDHSYEIKYTDMLGGEHSAGNFIDGYGDGYGDGQPIAIVLDGKGLNTSWAFTVTRGDNTHWTRYVDLGSVYTDARDGYTEGTFTLTTVTPQGSTVSAYVENNAGTAYYTAKTARTLYNGGTTSTYYNAGSASTYYNGGTTSTYYNAGSAATYYDVGASTTLYKGNGSKYSSATRYTIKGQKAECGTSYSPSATGYFYNSSGGLVGYGGLFGYLGTLYAAGSRFDYVDSTSAETVLIPNGSGTYILRGDAVTPTKTSITKQGTSVSVTKQGTSVSVTKQGTSVSVTKQGTSVSVTEINTTGSKKLLSATLHNPGTAVSDTYYIKS